MAKGKKLLNFLNKPLIKGLVKSIPFVGDLAENVLDETAETRSGTLDKNKLIMQIIRFAVLAGILYAVFSGKLSMDDAEGYKEFISE